MEPFTAALTVWARSQAAGWLARHGRKLVAAVLVAGGTAAFFTVTAVSLVSSTGQLAEASNACTTLGYAVDQAAYQPTPVGQEPAIPTGGSAPGFGPDDADQLANAQAIIAAGTTAGVGRRGLVVAIATALQESGLRNVDYGDRDSLGLFQQRPSQGWGSPEKLRDPVQSTSKFYDALVKVKGYQDLDLHDAAQRVQRSADGPAYAQHEPDGKVLARAFSGREASSVHCWYPPDKKTGPRRAEALREMRRNFGGRLQVDSPLAVTRTSQNIDLSDADPDAVKVTSPRTGWSVAIWAVSHAQTYGLTEVRHAKKRWTADTGHDGWQPDKTAPTDRVLIK